MVTNKNILKQWFQTGKKPTQAQFWAWLDSYWHKDESIGVNDINGLPEAIQNKADQSAFDVIYETFENELTGGTPVPEIPNWKTNLETQLNF